jgi:hypothetical protein
MHKPAARPGRSCSRTMTTPDDPKVIAAIKTRLDD